MKQKFTNLTKISIQMRRADFKTFSSLLGAEGINISIETGFSSKDVVKLNLDNVYLAYYNYY